MNAKQKVPVLWHLASGNADELSAMTTDDLDEVVDNILEALEELHTDIHRSWDDIQLGEAVGFALGLLLVNDHEIQAVELERALICRWIATGHGVDLITPASRTKLEVLGMGL